MRYTILYLIYRSIKHNINHNKSTIISYRKLIIISFWDTLRRLHPTTFSLRQFCRIAFSPGILLGQLFGVVFQYFLFEAILQNCILKTFPLRQFYEIVLSKYFFQNNSLESYYTKVFLRKFCRIVFSKYSFQDNSLELYPHILF
jgi:hypothetical protein